MVTVPVFVSLVNRLHTIPMLTRVTMICTQVRLSLSGWRGTSKLGTRAHVSTAMMGTCLKLFLDGLGLESVISSQQEGGIIGPNKPGLLQDPLQSLRREGLLSWL